MTTTTDTIVTSRSANAAYLKCPRLRWLQYEAPNGTARQGGRRASWRSPWPQASTRTRRWRGCCWG